MRKKEVTFKDISEYTGFSKTTVSRYFNDPDSLTLENQQKIADALEVLGYKENKVARMLASGKTEFIGVIVPNLFLNFYSEMLGKLLSTYEKYGYKFLVFAGNEQPETERKYISELLAYKIEGMIILSHTISSEELASYGVPVVCIEREDKYICSVNSDNFNGGKQGAEMLYGCGCDVLIHINSNVPEEIPAYKRITGFKEFCKEKSIPNEIILVDWHSEHSENVVKTKELIEYLDKKYPQKRKGLFLSNDHTAADFLNVLVRKNGCLPEDYRIVGFDNSSVSAEAVIPISTIGQQVDIITQEAMEILVALMNEQKKRKPVPLKEPVHKTVPTVAVCRDTTNNLDIT